MRAHRVHLDRGYFRAHRVHWDRVHWRVIGGSFESLQGSLGQYIRGTGVWGCHQMFFVLLTVNLFAILQWTVNSANLEKC